MRDDHVPERAGALVEAGPALDRELLGHVDLNVVDVVAVPDRLEHAVREPEREDVLDRLLAQEVVDAEDVALGKRRVEDAVQLAGGLEVGAERLLDDHARAAREAARRELLDDGLERRGGDRELEEPARAAADLTLGAGDGRGDVRMVRAEDAMTKVDPVGCPRPPRAEHLQGQERRRAHLVVAQGAARYADDPVALRHQADRGQVEETGDDLAPGQVAGRPVEHDHVIRRPLVSLPGHQRSPVEAPSTSAASAR